jgi:hypothetical protein
MDDNKFQELLNDVTKAHREYASLLAKAEKEYKRRFGSFPSDWDDDFWIDSFSQSPIGAKVEDVIRSAKIRKSRS